MGDVEATSYVRFPPLTSVIGLVDAPGRAGELLRDRWMAEPANPEPGAFLLRWVVSTQPCPETGASPSRVRWRPDGAGGRLSNAGGRVLVSAEGREARVELRSGAAEQPGCFEPLLEAALGHALADRGECFLHAAAIDLSGRSPLLLGASGSGKSTLAAAAAAFGGHVISDDSLLLGVVDGRPLVRSARRNVWLRPGSEPLVRALTAAGVAPEGGSDSRYRLDRARAAHVFRDATHPDSLVVLRRERGIDRIAHRRLSQADALAVLLQSTSALYVTDPRFARGRRPLIELIALFAERLPAIELAIGPALLESTEECLAAIVDALP